MSRRPKRKESQIGNLFRKYYTEGSMYISVSDAWRSMHAYQVLSPAEKLVLFDMLRHMRARAAGGNEKSVVVHGFTYTFSDCEEGVSENTFYKAMKKLVAIGWIETPVDIQVERPGAALYYTPSRKWESYQANDCDKRKLVISRARKKNRLQNKARQKSEFMASLSQAATDTTKKSRRKNCDVYSPNNCDVSNAHSSGTPVNFVTYGEVNTPISTPQNCDFIYKSMPCTGDRKRKTNSCSN